MALTATRHSISFDPPKVKRIMPRGFINHLDLTVTDVDASCAFYDKFLGRLGFVRSADYLGMVPCWVRSEAGHAFSIGIHEASAARPHDRHATGLHHVAFHLSSRTDVDAFYEYLVDEQVRILDSPTEYGYTAGYYALYLSDPDGIKFELVHEPRFDAPSA